uniref:Putative coat protein n=1 Tax=Atrato Virga-like virus 3 TaxID=2689342 RepID=A0A6B9KN53_9VIRU|nr:putative coat protein [Atrato Virga-like virus 3]
MDCLSLVLNRLHFVVSLPIPLYRPSIRWFHPIADEMANAPAYTNWNECPEVAVVKRRHMFCPIEDLLAFVEEHQFASFYVHTVRANIVAAARQLRGDAPFGRNTRFPDEREFADLDHEKIRGPLTQLLTSCELPDRHMNVGGGNGAGSSLNDAKRSFDTGFSQLCLIVKETRVATLARNGVYNRETFEDHYGLVWE